MPKPQGRAGRPWRRAQAAVYTQETHCWLCGKPVDPTLPPNHRLARSIDHIVPLSAGGNPLDRANLRLAHRTCNSSKGARTGRPHNPTSRQW